MKAFRDPVHNLIRFDKDSQIERMILDIIDSKEFQRLRHIRQLGFSFFTYPGAEHTRFAHSLGATHLMKRFIEQIERTKNKHVNVTIDEITDQRALALCAAILHDIGHGPFSHALEKMITVDKVNHEKWSVQIIKGNTEVNQILESYKSGFANEVAEVIERTHNSRAIVKLLSSQLDTDRIDYLLRDSMLTGAGYGTFDLEWLIHVLRIGKVGDHIEVGLDLEKGLNIAEDFVMARYYMYQNVYFHKTTRCAEQFAMKIFARVQQLRASGYFIEMPYELEKLLSAKDLQEVLQLYPYYLGLTDFKVWYYIDKWCNSDDLVLSGLCKQLLGRDLYKEFVTKEGFDSYKSIINLANLYEKEHGIPVEYILLEDDSHSSAYKDNYISSKAKQDEGQEAEATEQIFLFDKSGEAAELSQVSRIINEIRNNKIRFKRVFVPKDFRNLYIKKYG
ncbi:HD domain-containing protein [Desulfuribacillus alkaliarsenatis]|uniref:Phosphohydrolase n=1 Tax=Desulfuribacillus alkaliarsenatis TaxID=766136 RepID=A0A1E5G1R1_9FIRM|nr:HD domain-containing protein [Desulfuribacillus alkaliarsenatis]OEF96844.1 phosphohydrolase [Desulfuribacillus alkaliarsenatis]